MKVLFVTPEVAPFSSTGGLGEVASSLPHVLAARGVNVSVLTPLYQSVRANAGPLARSLDPLKIRVGRAQLQGHVYKAWVEGVRYLFLDVPSLYDRPGIYGENGDLYEDNALRYAAFSKAAVTIAQQLDMGFDLIHGNDWHCGLIPLFKKGAKGLGGVGCVHTIHNLAYQGSSPLSEAAKLGITKTYLGEDALGYGDQVNLMKAGILYADQVTTVSPTYAEEIQTEEFGCGLHEALKARGADLQGILNGVDYSLWSPELDRQLEFHFDSENQNGKRRCKAALQAEMGLNIRPRAPLIGAVTRFVEQKGTDILVKGLKKLLEKDDAQAVILGSGDKKLEKAVQKLADAHPGRVAVHIGYDEGLSHRIFAGTDLYAMPSRFEPCGLGQLYAMRYGSVPIVRSTGGLADTVIDHDPETGVGTGFTFQKATGGAFAKAAVRAIEAFHHARQWRQVIATAMSTDFSWRKSADAYIDVYERVLEAKK